MKISHDNQKDLALIAKVRKNDDTGVRMLFNKYLPLVKTFYRTYSVRGMDLDDWEQESVIVMLRCARHYNINGKYRFSTLYRTGLRNRFVDLIRKENAQRRIPTNTLTSFEANEGLYANTLEDFKASHPEESILIKEIFKKVLRRCSAFEKMVLLETINRRSVKEISQKNCCSLNKIVSAFERCQQKFRKVLKTEN